MLIMPVKRVDHKRLYEATQLTALRHDLLALYGLARHAHAKNIVEIGVRNGGSTVALYLALIENNGNRMTSIDIVPKCAKVLEGHERWHFVNGNSSDPELPEKAGIKYIDFLYLDSSHKREQTEKELKIWMPLVTLGGYAVFHDTKGPKGKGVREPLMEFYKREGKEWQWYEHAWHKFGLSILKCTF